MPIRRIKAHYATEEGDKVIIITESNRLSCVAFCLLIATITIYVVDQPVTALFSITALLIGLVIGLMLGNSKVEREVPRADLVEIKRYDWPKRVTVVLDDERSLMRKSNPPVKPTA